MYVCPWQVESQIAYDIIMSLYGGHDMSTLVPGITCRWFPVRMSSCPHPGMPDS